jgi:hypothetical protein
VKSNTRARTLTRGEVERLRASTVLRRIPGRNFSKADVVVHEVDGVRIALKDYRPRSLVVRQTLGRWLVRREARAYAAAAGIPGLPRFHGRVGPVALATEWIEGRVLGDLGPGGAPSGWDEGVGRILDALHGRGIALGDLHQRDVLVRSNGDVYVVDLATAVVLGARPGPLRRWLFARFRDQDRIALARLRARHASADEDAAVDAIGGPAARWYRRGRRARRWLDRLRGKTGAAGR